MRRRWISFLMLIGWVFLAKAQSGLVAHWSFDDIQGNTFFDNSQFENHGIVSGAELIDGPVGKALFFDGERDYAMIGNEKGDAPELFQELGEGSISLWFRVDYIPAENGIAPIFYYGGVEMCDFFDAANNGLIIEVGHSPIHYGSERLYFTIWKNGCTFPSFCYDSNHAIPVGEWQHVVIVVGTDFNTGYLNGKEMKDRRYNFGTSGYSQFFEDAVKHELLWLGMGYWDRSIQHFKGGIDEIKIFDRALNMEEVSKLYNEGNAELLQNLSDNQDEEFLFPNPSNGMIRISANIAGKSFLMRILNANGQYVHTISQGWNSEWLDLRFLDNGLYFLEYFTPDGNTQQKFLISK